jgi:hypothetical protein
MPRSFVSLIVGHGLVVFLLCCLVATGWYESHWLTMAAIGTCFTQASFLGLYAGLAQRPMAERLAIVALGAGWLYGWVYFFAIVIAGPYENDREEAILSLLFAIAPLASAWLAASVIKPRGLRLRRQVTSQPTAGPLQFTIGHLFLVTFVSACILVVSRVFRAQAAPFQMTSLFLLELSFALLVGILAAAQTAVIVATLSASRGSWLLLLVWGAIAALIWGLTFGDPLSPDWLGASVTQTTLTALTLIVLRRLGYRVVRESRNAKSTGGINDKAQMTNDQ